MLRGSMTKRYTRAASKQATATAVTSVVIMIHLPCDNFKCRNYACCHCDGSDSAVDVFVPSSKKYGGLPHAVRPGEPSNYASRYLAAPRGREESGGQNGQRRTCQFVPSAMARKSGSIAVRSGDAVRGGGRSLGLLGTIVQGERSQQFQRAAVSVTFPDGSSSQVELSN